MKNKDTARLDWLDKDYGRMDDVAEILETSNKALTLRKAIDAAIRAEKARRKK